MILLLSSPLSLKILLTRVEATDVSRPVNDLKGLDQILKNGIALNLGIEVVSNLGTELLPPTFPEDWTHNRHFLSQLAPKLSPELISSGL